MYGSSSVARRNMIIIATSAVELIEILLAAQNPSGRQAPRRHPFLQVCPPPYPTDIQISYWSPLQFCQARLQLNNTAMWAQLTACTGIFNGAKNIQNGIGYLLGWFRQKKMYILGAAPIMFVHLMVSTSPPALGIVMGTGHCNADQASLSDGSFHRG